MLYLHSFYKEVGMDTADGKTKVVYACAIKPIPPPQNAMPTPQELALEIKNVFAESKDYGTQQHRYTPQEKPGDARRIREALKAIPERIRTAIRNGINCSLVVGPLNGSDLPSGGTSIADLTGSAKKIIEELQLSFKEKELEPFEFAFELANGRVLGTQDLLVKWVTKVQQSP